MGIAVSAAQKNDKTNDSIQPSFDPYNNDKTDTSDQDFADPWDKESNENKAKNKPDAFIPFSASDESSNVNVEASASDESSNVKSGAINDLVNEIFEKREKNKEIVENVLKKYKCEIFGLSNLLVGSTAGAVIGAVQGVATNTQHFGKYGFGKVVATASGNSALSFGLWLGCYSYTKCHLITFRKKDDFLNTFGGAFTAGALASLRSRNPAQIATNGLISGVIMTFMESLHV